MAPTLNTVERRPARSSPSSRGSTPRSLRLRNQRLVLAEIRHHSTLTRSDLAKATGLAKSTIKEITDALVASGFIEEVRDVTLDGRVGRPASSLRISRTSGYVVGVDIGADKILVGIAGLDGQLISLERTVTHDLHGKAAILEATRSTIDKGLKRSAAQSGRIVATVVGTPGVIDPRTGRVSLAPQIAGWEGIDLRSELKLSVEGEIVIRRQADLSALAEVALGAARNVRNLLYVHIGIGIGGALVINSDLYGGNDGAAAEIGYLPLGFGDAPPAGSGFGTFEWSAGGSAFARAGSQVARGPSGKRLRELAGGDPGKVTAAAVFAAAAEGDPQGLTVATQMADRLATGIAAAICVVNPELAVVSGGISLAGGMLLEMIRPRVSEIVPVMPELVISALGEESVVMGGIQHGVDLALDRLLVAD
jgi:predicted NBD/HSP70 family sugar kinase